MGMYDLVRFEIECPGCGEIVSSFQSQDGECILNWVNPSDVDNFYTDCWNCGDWLEVSKQESGEYMLSFYKYEHYNPWLPGVPYKTKLIEGFKWK